MRAVALGWLVPFVCLSIILGTFLIARFVILTLPFDLEYCPLRVNRCLSLCWFTDQQLALLRESDN